ncbi:MAG: PepSY domain-containing protein [Xanthobacteraceae bacterium]|nr:PepSY domain-containing protein [Xanthobacteraceae bacterium]
MKIWSLKLHRWVALTFALPLVFVLGTGLILSFEPWLVVRAMTPGALSVAKVEALLNQHDPDGKARSIVYRSYDGTLTLSAGPGDGTVIDIANGQELAGPSSLANLVVTARRMHERLLINAGWLVIASSVVMLILAILGILMGLPRVTNTLSSWHKGMAWGVLPLIVLSPLTGLLLASNITFMSAPPAAVSARGAPLRLADAVRIIGETHDLSTLIFIRPQGGRLLARLVEGGEYRVYAVNGEGMTALPRNWPRLWHEGNFAGAWSALLNLIASVAMIGLLITGPLIWLRRRLRLRARRVQQLAPAE